MVLVAVGGGGLAKAAFPGDNGRIAFTNGEVKAGNPEGDQEIYTMNPDGSNQTNLTNTPAGNESFLDWGVAVAPPDTNKPPVASNDSYSTNQGQPLNEAAPGVLANDTDPEGNTLTAVKVSGPANGTLTLNSDGSFTYTPSSGFSGSDTFTYKAYDGTADSNTVTVTITVNPVDTPAPTVFGLNPSDGQTGVSTATNITLTFSETMDESTLNDNTVKLVKPGRRPTSIPITMTKSTDGSGSSVLTLDPFGSAKQNLAGTTTYQLTIEGAGDTDGFAVRDVASNELARDAVSSFTTAKK